MIAVEWVELFCQRLADLRLPQVFNPYSQRCPIHDLPNAPEIRQRNLRRILSHHASKGVTSIWFGRDLGYRGGRRTGLALTDEATMISGYSGLGPTPLEKATTGPIQFERTASVIWELISRLGQTPVLWNAFPLHPHEVDNPMSNRTHTIQERRATGWCIAELRARFPDAKLIAIGNDASNALGSLGFDHEAVRHPSYGGQRDFTLKMEELHGITRVPGQTAQPTLFG